MGNRLVLEHKASLDSVHASIRSVTHGWGGGGGGGVEGRKDPRK
jgi:uncharacterized membrane protein